MTADPSHQRPYTVTTFGSAIVRVSPDQATLRFAVARTEKNPGDAFQKAREAAGKVQTYLKEAGQADFGSSRIQLQEEIVFDQGVRRVDGYTARIAFQMLLGELDRVEEILIGLTDAGVNAIESVEYQTSRLKELREGARVRAVEAALEKADVYCRAAGVVRGEVTMIEDENPEAILGREGASMNLMEARAGKAAPSFDPGEIVISGAVRIACEIKVGDPAAG